MYRTPSGRLLAFWADGRVAVRAWHAVNGQSTVELFGTADQGYDTAVQQTQGKWRWEPLDHISYDALWPEPAPVADAKPAVRWLNRSTWWCDDCQAAHGAEIPICFCGTRRPTPTP